MYLNLLSTLIINIFLQIFIIDLAISLKYLLKFYLITDISLVNSLFRIPHAFCSVQTRNEVKKHL